MERNQILEKLSECGALHEGHFVLSSGMHSEQYIQCASIFTNPKICRILCASLAQKVIEKFGENFADIIVAPAVGAIIMGYVMGDLLNLESVFCERGADDKFTMKRDFDQKIAGKRVLIAEVVTTTCKSSLEAIDCVKEFGGNVVGQCIFVNRCADLNILPVPAVSLIDFNIPIFAPDNLPERLQKMPAVYPGSRKKFTV